MKFALNGAINPLITVDAVLKVHTYIGASETAYDTLLAEYILTATAMIQKKVGYPISANEITIFTKASNCRAIIPKNTNALSSVYIWEDEAWTAVTLEGSNLDRYNLYSELFASNLVDGNYKIVATTTADANPKLKQCCRLLVAEMFEQRENKETNGTRSIIDTILADESLLL